MSTADDLHSELGALEEQVERLGELKSLIERLETTKESARAAADAAEKATRANKQVVDAFDNVAGRIEQSDAVQQLEELENQIERLKRAREEVEEELGLLSDWLEIELEDHRTEVLGTLTEKLEKQSRTLDNKVESKLESQAEVLDQLHDGFEEHGSEIKSKLKEQAQSLSETLSGKLETHGEDLGRLQNLMEEHREDQEERLTSLKEGVEQIRAVLKDAELVSRLERITDTSKSASQAAQNTLSRIEAVERNLGQSISQNHDRREDAEEKMQDAVATLKTQVYSHIALSIGILAVLILEVFGMI